MQEPKIIDLTYPLRSDMHVYPGHERPVFQWLKRVNSEGCNVSKFSMHIHTGTHVDAPKHFLDDVLCIDEVPLNRLFGTARLFRYTKELHGQEITVEDIHSSGFELEEDIIFVLESGLQKFEETRKYNQVFPVPSDELCQWLIGKKIKAYMTDAPGLDVVGSPDDAKHHLILGAGIPIVENLRNLHLLPENKPFVISALPLKLHGLEGAPCRAIALPDVAGL